jgi:hypothetical protein
MEKSERKITSAACVEGMFGNLMAEGLLGKGVRTTGLMDVLGLHYLE